MTKNEVLTQKLTAQVGEHIGYELGAKMIKDYYDKYNEGGCHFVGRDIVERILNQPGCIGIKIFKALNESQEKTYVFVGVGHDGELILENTYIDTAGEMRKEEGIVADRKIGNGWFNIR
jgi:DhnA family fructose-bisphosphate aldolase class Ia